MTTTARSWTTAFGALVLATAGLVALPSRPASAAAATPAVTGVRVVNAKTPPTLAEWTAEAHAVRGPRTVVWPAAGTAAVDLGSQPARAGSLPIVVRQAGTREAAAAGRVRVTVADRAATARTGVSGVLFTLEAADARSGSAAVEVEYAGFASAFGADFGSRLALVQLRACALTTPERAECQGGTPVAYHNDMRAQRVSADVAVSAASPTVLALTGGAAGDNGDYRATDLTPAGSWQTSHQTGSFTWAHPLRMPPVPAGPVPSLSLSYSSGAIDGRTSTTNNQGSWIGDGWSMWPGFIERSYNSCSTDSTTKKTGDLCWLSDNATLSLNGHSGELIKSGSVWRLKSDDGTKIEKVTGDSARANGARDSEYWKVTTTDGMQYYFGYHRLPNWQSGNAVTDSTWTVPVFGDDADDECPQAYCTQAWRWNLDYVVDPHGNTQALFYGKETGAFGQNNTATTRVTYDRGGWLDRIEYGMRYGTEYAQAAPAKVVFDARERCLSGCWTGAAWTSTPIQSAWLDSPWDQYCTTTPCTVFSPTFWTARRLLSVTTKVRTGTTSYKDVESWTLRHEFLDAGTSEGTPMWLRGITNTGLMVASGVTPPTKPEITFDPGTVPLPNRVDGAAAGRTALNRWRITTITTESGGQVQVAYSPTSDCSRTAPPNPEFNTSRCMPVLVDLAGNPTLDWFHKYVVKEVIAIDRSTGQPQEVTSYDYLDGAAWHYATDEVTKDNLRTWNEWRGYGRVQVRRGHSSQRQTMEEYRYLRGMDEDKSPSSPGGKRDVSVADGWGGTVEDHDSLQGFQLAQFTFDGPTGAEVDSAVNRPWRRGPTATRTRGGVVSEAWMMQLGEARARTALAAGGYRYAKKATAYNDEGLPTSVDDAGDEGLTTDDTCTLTVYARNTATWMLDRVAQQESLTGKCSDAATPAVPSTVLSRTRTFYDSYTGEASFGAAPTKGDPIRVEELDQWSGTTPVYVAVSRTTFDAYGLPDQVLDARDKAATTVRTMPYGLITKIETGNAANHDTIQEIEPAWGLPTKVYGPNNEVGGTNDLTALDYDGFGRLTEVRLPGRAASQSPSARFTYLDRNGAGLPTVVTSEALLPSGAGYRKSAVLHDGWLRVRQTQVQAPGGGRTLADVHYDSAGAVVSTTNQYYDTSNTAVNTTVGVPVQTVPGVTRYLLDGADRQTAEVFDANGTEAWRTTTIYGGDWTTVIPPRGGTATTSLTDARGRVVELRQYRDRADAGSTNAAHYVKTAYSYKPTGALGGVIDAAQNVWSFDYDLRGRQTVVKDPDKGQTTQTYDAVGNLETTKNALNETTWYGYDDLNRRIETRAGSSSGTQLAQWVYDTLPYGKGRLTSATRFEGTTEYTRRVDTYDKQSRETQSSVVLPSTSGALCAAGGLTPCVYSTKTSYRANGLPYQITMPAAGDLPSEKLTFGYTTDTGLLNTLITDLTSYVATVTYDKLGRITERQLGPVLSRIVTSSVFDQATGRLTSSVVDNPDGAEAASYQYTYDERGNISRITDAPEGQTADHQCFTLDGLRRLADAWTPLNGNCATAPTVAGLQTGNAAYWHEYRFDDIGNRRTHSSYTTAGATEYSSTPPASGATSVRPHSVPSVTMTPPSGTGWTRSYTYDAAGRTRTRPSASGVTQTLAWTAEHRLTSVTEGTAAPTTFVYDANGDRLLRTESSGARTLSLAGQEVRVAAGASTATATRYYTHGDSTVAMRTGAGVTWLAGDHHGTASVAIKATDRSVSKRRTAPFGAERGSTGPEAWPTGTDTGFVGGVKDATELTHLGAREYDPFLGRFVSVDPILDTTDPQSTNNYAYAGNNPVDFTDPAGTRRCPPDQEDTCTENPSNYVPRSPAGGGNGGSGNGGSGGGGSGGGTTTGCGGLGPTNRSASCPTIELTVVPTEDPKKSLYDTCKEGYLGCLFRYLGGGTSGLCVNTGIAVVSNNAVDGCIISDQNGVAFAFTETHMGDAHAPRASWGWAAGAGVSLQISDATTKNSLSKDGHFASVSVGPEQVGYGWTTDSEGRDVHIGEWGLGAGVGGSGGRNYTYVSGYIFEACGWWICNIGNSTK